MRIRSNAALMSAVVISVWLMGLLAPTQALAATNQPTMRSSITVGRTPPPGFAPPTSDATVVHSNRGVTLQTPATWELTPSDDSTIFSIKIDDETEFSLEDSGEDFPGILLIPLIKTNIESLVSEMGEEGKLESMTPFTTDQGLPAIRIEVSGKSPFDSGGDYGALFVVVTGKSGYGLFGGGSAASWAAIKDDLQAMIETMVVDPELITLTQAITGEVEYADSEAGYVVTVPQDWFVSPTGEKDISTLVANPDVDYVMALAMRTSDQDEAVLKALAQATAGEIPEEIVREIATGVLTAMDIREDQFQGDAESVKILPTLSGSGVVVRFAGAVELDGSTTSPLLGYLHLDSDRAAMGIVIGDVTKAEDEQDTLLKLLESIRSAE